MSEPSFLRASVPFSADSLSSKGLGFTLSAAGGSSIMEQIRRQVLPEAERLSVSRVCVGVGYTVVSLSDGSAGAAYTFRDELGSGCGVISRAGSLAGMPAAELIGCAGGRNLALSACGLAAMNAILNRPYNRGDNVLTAMSAASEDTIGMVGWFCPFVNHLQEAGRLYVFERSPRRGKLPGNAEAKSEQDEDLLLPTCNKVIVTGTAFLNGTIDHILALCRGAKEILIVGASTPMCPSVLRPLGVTVLAGTKITDPDRALQIAAEGGGTMELNRAGIKLLEYL